MNTYSNFEYLLINAANAYGKDKLLFEERIEFMKENGKNLRKLVETADDKHLFIRAILEIERVLAGQKFTNMPIGLDATASGLQMLAVMSGCMTTASHVGLVDPNKRCDAYTACGDTMNIFLPEDKQIILSGVAREGQYQRKDLKDPLEH